MRSEHMCDDLPSNSATEYHGKQSTARKTDRRRLRYDFDRLIGDPGVKEGHGGFYVIGIANSKHGNCKPWNYRMLD